jgi:Tfp pilus assembly protein PilF
MNEAIARFTRMVEENPGNELARYSLGKALFDQGDYAAAREHLRVAMSHKPDWMAAQILLARCELNLDNKAAARPALEYAMELARKQGHVGPLAQVEELMKQLG